MRLIFVLAVAACCFSSCRSIERSASKEGFSFAQIKTVELSADSNLSAFISKELLLTGISAISSKHALRGADGVLKVTINRETPDKKYLIRPRKIKRENTLSQTNPTASSTQVTFIEEDGHSPIEVSGTLPMVTQSFGAGGEVLLASYAQVVLSGELIHSGTGDVLWAGSYSYEGLDLESALEGAARGLVQSVPWGEKK